MKLGEIKLEALRLMCIYSDTNLPQDDTLTLAQDETYGAYLCNMPGAINRCMADMERREVLPLRARTLPYDALFTTHAPAQTAETPASGTPAAADASPLAAVTDGVMRLSLAACLPAGAVLVRVARAGRGGYERCVRTEREGDTLLLPAIGKDESLTLVYRAAAPRVSAVTPDNTELDLPERLAAAVPYYIKGDLFRADEPNEAGEARNFYEAAMEAERPPEDNITGGVCSVYAQEAI